MSTSPVSIDGSAFIARSRWSLGLPSSIETRVTVPATLWLSSEMALMSLPMRLVELVMFWPKQHGVERAGELVGGADLADLVDLVQHLAVVHRIERILILHFGDQQLQEHVEIEIVERVELAELAVGRRRVQQ